MPLIKPLSDVHNEFGWLKLPPSKDDHKTVLVLAGDIHVKDGVCKIPKGETKPWIKELSERFLAVIYVLGNHEHYTQSLDLTANKIKTSIAALDVNNVHVLNNASVIIDGVKFIGTTMWTDFNGGDPLTEYQARIDMKDYKYIRINKYLRKIHPNDLKIEHFAAKQYLLSELGADFDGQVVIVTHHAPTHLSIDEHYADDYLSNGCYFSRLEDLMLDNSKIALWVHGHVHCSKDYMVGNTRVICNPRGYTPGELNEDFEPDWIINIIKEKVI